MEVNDQAIMQKTISLRQQGFYYVYTIFNGWGKIKRGFLCATLRDMNKDNQTSPSDASLIVQERKI